MSKRIALVTAAALVAMLAAGSSTEAAVRLVAPESVGFSSERLQRLDALMRQVVNERQYAGVVTLVARHGKVVHFNAVGRKDVARGSAMEQDTIFRIFSMTKPVTAAAMMMLYEEGSWTAQDPLCKFIPQFQDLNVYKGVDAAGRIQLESASHPPTMRELMTMTAGFGYGAEQTPVDRLYRGAKDENIFLSGSLQAMVGRLAKAPLLYQPGSSWKYSLSADVQGYLIEKLTGMTLPQFMQRRLFDPLKMKDTSFQISADKRNRLASLYQESGAGELTLAEPPAWNRHEGEPALPQGGAGLVSTAEDYFRFAQMLLNGGQLNGVRVLGPRTVELMMSNHLPDSLMRQLRGGGYEFAHPRPGVGYAFNGAVITDPGLAGMPVGRGTYLWDGAAGTWFWIDPTFGIVVVGMVQRLRWGIHDNVPGLPPNLEQLSMGLIYQALLHRDQSIPGK
jgi:CubicO group peptidase (beta-lactamase class C family)